MNLHDSLVWRADTNKAHRCPCWAFPEGHPLACNGYVSSEETDWTFKRLHVYRCAKCGIRVTTFPGWPGLPGTDEWRYWSRAKWFFGRGLRYKIGWQLDRLRFRRDRRYSDEGDGIWVERTEWRERLLFNCWRAPFPYLFHRWDVQTENGWASGFWFRSQALAYVQEYRRLP